MATQATQQQQSVAKEIRTAVRHSAVYGFGAMLVKAIGFFMLPVYTHYLRPEDYGVLEILDLSMSLLGMVLNMGMTAALLRYYAAAASDAEKREVVSTALVFVTGTAAIMLFLAFGFSKPISTLLFGPSMPHIYALISCLSFILGYVGNLPRTYLRALEASGRFVLLDTLGVFAILALNILFIVVLKTGLVGILLSSLLVNIAWTGVTAWAFQRVGYRFSKSLVYQMLSFGLPLIFSNLAIFTLNFSDRFFLKHFWSLEAVGIYAVGYKIGFMLNYLLVQPFYGMWQARMYIVHGHPDHPNIFGQISVLYSTGLIYAGLAISIFSREIVNVMMESRFSASQNIIPLIVWAYVFYGIGYYVQLGMFLTKKTQKIGIISAAAAILNLGLNYVLIRYYGMMGAAWATLLSFAVIAAGSYWLSQTCLRLPLNMPRILAVLALAVGFYFVARWFQPDSLWRALALKTSLLAFFPLILWRAGAFSQGEIDTIVSTSVNAWDRVARFIGLAPRTALEL